MLGLFSSARRMTSMILAYRESAAGRVARMVRADSPLIAPEITSDPGVLDIWNGSPVRNDSSITPRPSVTTPSTGQMSCGKSASTSPMATSLSGTSTTSVPVRLCAIEGIRLASARNTEEALRTA
jgi:hypothetical protein